ncbi:MAG: hypothetical protein ACUVQ4_08630, partial [bacterium]
RPCTRLLTRNCFWIKWGMLEMGIMRRLPTYHNSARISHNSIIWFFFGILYAEKLPLCSGVYL